MEVVHQTNHLSVEALAEETVHRAKDALESGEFDEMVFEKASMETYRVLVEARCAMLNALSSLSSIAALRSLSDGRKCANATQDTAVVCPR